VPRVAFVVEAHIGVGRVRGLLPFQTGGTYGSGPAFESDEGSPAGFLLGRNSPAAARVSSEDPAGGDRDRGIFRRDTKEKENPATTEPARSSRFLTETIGGAKRLRHPRGVCSAHWSKPELSLYNGAWKGGDRSSNPAQDRSGIQKIHRVVAHWAKVRAHETPLCRI
jgi:hypothetical protein